MKEQENKEQTIEVFSIVGILTFPIIFFLGFALGSGSGVFMGVLFVFLCLLLFFTLFWIYYKYGCKEDKREKFQPNLKPRER